MEKPDFAAGGNGKEEKAVDVEQRVFYNAIVEGKPLVVEPGQAMTVTRILEAVYESARTGKAIYLS